MSEPRPSRLTAPLIALAAVSAGRPRAAVALLVVLSVLAGLFAGAVMQVSTDTSELISEKVPYRARALDYRAAFDRAKDRVVTIVSAESVEEADRAAGALYGRLIAQPDLFADVEAPAQDPFFLENGLLYRSPAALERFADALAGAQAFLASVAEKPGLDGLAPPLVQGIEAVGEGRAPADQVAPVLEGLAATAQAAGAGAPRAMGWSEVFGGEAQATRRFVLFTPVLAETRFSRAKPALEGYAAALDAARAAHPGATFQATGEPLIRRAEIQSVTSGLSLAGVVSLIAVSLILAWGLRSARLTAALALGLVLGLALTVGLGAATVGRLNLISVAFVVLFIGLSVDFGVHFGLRIQEARGAGLTGRAAARAAAAGVGGALLLSALCAAAGFLSFLPTAYDGLAELGVIAAGGMGVALLVNLILPSAFFGARTLSGGRPERGEGAGGAFARLVTRRAGLLTAAGGVSAALALLLALGLRIDLNPLNLAPRDEAVRVYESLAEDAQANPYTASVLVDGRAEAEALAARFSESPLVGEARTVLSLLPDNQDDKLFIIEDLAFFAPPPLAARDDDPAARMAARDDLLRALEGAPAALETPAARLAEALRALEPETLARFEADVIGPLARIIAVAAPAPVIEPLALEDVPERLTARWIAPNGRWRVEAVPAENLNDPAAMAAFVDAVSAIDARATGAPVNVVAAGRVVGGAFLTASVLSLLAVTVLTALILRDAVGVALTLTTPILATLWTGAGAALTGTPLNFANVIVAPLLFGLGASASIHMVARHRAAVRAGETANLFASSTPKAVALSALTTLASFGSLLLSDHRGMNSMGVLLTIAIAAILAASLIVLPALLTLTSRAGAGKASD